MKRFLILAVGMAIFLSLSVPTQLKAQVWGEFDGVQLETQVPYTELGSSKTTLEADEFGLPPTFSEDKNDGYARVPLGFDFEFNGEVYDHVWISINGFLTFGRKEINASGQVVLQNPPNVPANEPRGLFIASGSYPVNVIAPFWGDHYYREDADTNDNYVPSEISYISSSDQFVVQWKNLNINDPSIPSSVGNFQAILYKSDDPLSLQGTIKFAYGPIGNNPYTDETVVIYVGSSVGLKGEASDYLNGLYYDQSEALARTQTDLTDQWQPSDGRSDARIVFDALNRFNIEEFWGDGDVDFSKAPGRVHFGLPQNRYVTVNDVRVILKSVATGVALDPVRRRAAYHGDVNHDGRYYYNEDGERVDIPWKNMNFYEDLPDEVSSLRQILFEATEYDASWILKYIAGKVPYLPWIYDTTRTGKSGIDFETADNVTFGKSYRINDNVVEIPVYLNGNYNGNFGAKFKVDGIIDAVSSNPVEEQEIFAFNSENTVAVAGNGDFSKEQPVLFVKIRTENDRVELSEVRFNDVNKDKVVVTGSSAEDMTNTKLNLYVDEFSQIFANISESASYKLEAYDLQGNLVNVIFNGRMDEGSHLIEWDKTNEDGSSLRTGAYILRLSGNGEYITAKFVISK
ncbi:MAG: FlgD immunoglobulin-like domain containing protein [Candidatus Kapaibacterium sp.]